MTEDCIEAPDLGKAEETARAFCGTGPGYQFIYVKPFIVASWQATDEEPVAVAKAAGKARVGA